MREPRILTVRADKSFEYMVRLISGGSLNSECQDLVQQMREEGERLPVLEAKRASRVFCVVFHVGGGIARLRS